FDDVRVRQALILAFSPDDYNTTVHQGTAVLAPSIFDKSSPYFNPSVVQGPQDLAKTQSLIDQYYAATGKNVTATLYGTPTNGPDIEYVATFWDNALKHVSINTATLPNTQYIDKVYTRRDFQVGISGVNLLAPDVLYDYFITGGANNYSGIAN